MFPENTDIETYELVSLAQSLMNFPNINPPGDDYAIAHFLNDYLEELGLEVRCDDLGGGRHNVIAVWKGEQPGPVLLLNGHYDVVEPGQGWSVNPFESVVRDGWLIGRGAVDMKAGIAALIMAVKNLKNAKFPLKGSIVLAAVADEEVAQSGSLALARAGLKADFALVAEPSLMVPIIAHRGRRIYEIFSTGKTAHAALPENGVNAITPLISFLETILEKASEFRWVENPLLGSSTFTLTTIKGGSAVNSVPDRCQATIDFRHLPEHDPAEVDREIQTILDEVAKDHPHAGLGWRVLFSSPALECPADMPLVRALRSASLNLYGYDPGARGYQATTDAGVLSSIMGIPTVVCGPGDLRQAHQPDEKIEVAELVKGMRIYMRVIEELMRA